MAAGRALIDVARLAREPPVASTFVRDLDGNNVELVNHIRAQAVTTA
jgi:hypothetical protein